MSARDLALTAKGVKYLFDVARAGMIGHGDCAVARDMGAPDQLGGQEYTVREETMGVEIVDQPAALPSV